MSLLRNTRYLCAHVGSMHVDMLNLELVGASYCHHKEKLWRLVKTIKLRSKCCAEGDAKRFLY